MSAANPFDSYLIHVKEHCISLPALIQSLKSNMPNINSHAYPKLIIKTFNDLNVI